MGCEWIVPDWNRKLINHKRTVRYCRATAPLDEGKNMTMTALRAMCLSRCTVVNWIQYFAFEPDDEYPPLTEANKVIKVRIPSRSTP